MGQFLTANDGRYQIAQEWCGHPKRRFVVRFCDEYIGNAEAKGQARQIAESHYRDLRHSMGIPI